MIGGICLTAARLLSAAWVGGAILFVITSVAEQTHPAFDSMTRDQLATVRFPLYYLTGFVVYGMVLLCTAVGSFTAPGKRRRQMRIAAGVVLVSGIVFAFDYLRVYAPLQQLITPPGQARTAEFERLHTLSARINGLHVLLMLSAAVLLTVPATNLGGEDRAAD